jgi:hypothetical protein
MHPIAIELIVEINKVTLKTDLKLLPVELVQELLNTIHNTSIKNTLDSMSEFIIEAKKAIESEDTDDQSDDNIPKCFRGVSGH